MRLHLLVFPFSKVHCIDPNVMVCGDPGCYPEACIRAHQRAIREGPLRDSLTLSKVCSCQHNQHFTYTGEESRMELEIPGIYVLVSEFHSRFLFFAGMCWCCCWVERFWWSIGWRRDAMTWIGRAQMKCGAATANCHCMCDGWLCRVWCWFVKGSSNARVCMLLCVALC